MFGTIDRLSLWLLPALGACVALGAAPAHAVTTLTFTGLPGYEADGVQPDVGAPGAPFTFRVRYTDSLNRVPTYVRLYLYKPGGAAVTGNPSVMTGSGATTWTTGVDYVKQITLSVHGRYAYRFAAQGSSAASLPAMGRFLGPAVDRAPTMTWAGLPGFTTDGVESSPVKVNRQVTFKIKYRDADADPAAWVKVHVWGPDGLELADSPLIMTRAVGPPNWTTGVIFVRRFTPTATGSYQYQFEANDDYQAVRWPASPWVGPLVTP